MKSTPLTQGASTLILAVYLIHTFMTSPLTTVLIAIAAGTIAYGYLESYELAVAFCVVVGVLFNLLKQTKFSYETKFTKEGFSTTDTAQQIVGRVAEIKKEEPRGVLSSGFVEGFEDVSGNKPTTTTQTKAPTTATPASQASPAPASTNGNAGSGMTPPAPPAAAAQIIQQAATGGQASAASGFTGSSKKDMEFKLGVIPEDTKGGYHIDQGTTVMNALNALKPDQIKAMTEDTRKLIDTQKNLMSMLGTMKPMLQDGKQMMANFQEMFGNSNGAMKF
jgi:hypothetical protein